MTESQEEKTEILQAFMWRLASAADAAGLSQIEIAERLGVSRSRVGNWFQGNNFPRKAERVTLAKLLNVTVDWLIHGRTEMNRIRPKEIEEARAAFGGSPMRQIPVVSWSHAGAATAYEELPKHFRGEISTMSTDPRAFGLTVEGDSMEPKVFPGDHVVCEPSRAPINGKPVVARFVDDQVVLRLYHKMPGGKIRLAPANPMYPVIEHDPSEFFWIYPVRELVRAF